MSNKRSSIDKKEMPMTVLTKIKPVKLIVRGIMLAGLSVSLSACISLSAKPPPSLLTLTASSKAPAGILPKGSRETTIRILEPDVPQRLNVTRVPVQVDATEIAYLKDAVWVERPARLFRNLLAETFRARTGRLVIDADYPGVEAKTTLRGTLHDFGYDAKTSSVVVRYDAVRMGAGDIVETRRFESTRSGIAAEPAAVGAALNDAANDVAEQVAGWIG